MKRNWKEALALMGIKPTKKPVVTALFEVDAADGTKLTFPEINDLTELKDGVTTTTEDGEYIFQADGKTYTVIIAGGVVSSVVESEDDVPPTDMPEGLVEALQVFADEFEAKDTAIAELKAEAAANKAAIEALRALMSHSKDDTGSRGENTIVLRGKKIDLNKLNNK